MLIDILPGTHMGQQCPSGVSWLLHRKDGHDLSEHAMLPF